MALISTATRPNRNPAPAPIRNARSVGRRTSRARAKTANPATALPTTSSRKTGPSGTPVPWLGSLASRKATRAAAVSATAPELARLGPLARDRGAHRDGEDDAGDDDRLHQRDRAVEQRQGVEGEAEQAEGLAHHPPGTGQQVPQQAPGAAHAVGRGARDLVLHRGGQRGDESTAQREEHCEPGHVAMVVGAGPGERDATPGRRRVGGPVIGSPPCPPPLGRSAWRSSAAASSPECTVVTCGRWPTVLRLSRPPTPAATCPVPRPSARATTGHAPTATTPTRWPTTTSTRWWWPCRRRTTSS